MFAVINVHTGNVVYRHRFCKWCRKYINAIKASMTYKVVRI